jgi:iron complex transport system substrate-binding protein
MSSPQRITSLLASGTEILYGLGLDDRIVAVSHECDYPPAAQDKPRVTHTNLATAASSLRIDAQVREITAGGAPLYELDQARLSALSPDLIVTQAQCDVCAIKYDDVLSFVRDHAALAGCEVVALNPTRLEDLFTDIQRLARVTDCEAAGEAYEAALRARIEAVRLRVAPVPLTERPTVGCIEWIEPLMIAANWTPDLIELAGARQTLTTAGVHSSYTPWDEFLAYNPDCVVIMPCGFNLARSLDEALRLSTMPGWSELKAVKQKRVYAVDGNAYFNRSGPRLIDSLEILARLVHPARFGIPADQPGEADIWQRFDVG